LILILLLLSAAAFLGSYTSYRAGIDVEIATGLEQAFQKARYAVGAEESLERKYRLEPSPEVRARHREAGSSMIAALEVARTLGADVQLIEGVVASHKQYLLAIEHMFTAIDRLDSVEASRIDSGEVDPTFDKMEAQVSQASDRYGAKASDQLQSLANTQRGILIATPIVCVLGLALVAFFWSLFDRYRQQVENGLVRETDAMRHSEERLKSLAQNSSDVVLIGSPAGLVTYQSSAAETAWGYAADCLLDQPLIDLIHVDDRPALLDIWAQVQIVPGTTRITELQLRWADGEWRFNELILTNLLDNPSVAGLVVTVRDVTERKAFEKQLTQQAFYDALTGLPNRVLLQDRLNQALARAGRNVASVGLLFLDIDNFKQINDSLGHHVGDAFLKEAANRLRACVREDQTVSRLGGDEFVVLLERLHGEAGASDVADRIAQHFLAPFHLRGREFNVTTSIGIAFGTAGPDAADGLLRDADVAMYRAKSRGKAQHVTFDPAMNTDIIVRVELENDLRRAQERGELCVHYQPIVVMESGTVTEVEALVRWQHPTRGLISPANFITVAEETGLIVPLGQWVLEEACRQIVELQKRFPKNPPLVVSVNLSPRQFQQPALIDMVAHALSASGLPATSLKLEITEGVLMRDTEATIAMLWKLKELGIKLAIDDFGTGYSSLAYLKRLPFDVLKIDRSFVSGIGQSEEDTAIVQAVIAMAKSLRLGITAEGIETAEQAAVLKSWDCQLGQGFFFARLLTPTGLAALLSEAQFADAEFAAA
jgi:diguanylate cyclase (GGDEF)-like protein/PAS domain S-box-containing protein